MDLPDGSRPPEMVTFTASGGQREAKIPTPGIEDFERHTLALMAVDLQHGVPPEDVIHNWATWRADKGGEEYFRGLVAKASKNAGESHERSEVPETPTRERGRLR
jgi:hypothetical protein